MRRRVRAALSLSLLLVSGLALAACGTENVDLPGEENAQVKRGAQLFAERCSGCHTFDPTGTEGSADNIRTRERTDGPNFNQRKESVEAVLYAIRNGGFSGAIMPQNIVVGEDAQAVAEFLAKYSGRDRTNEPSPDGENQASPSERDSGSGGDGSEP